MWQRGPSLVARPLRVTGCRLGAARLPLYSVRAAGRRLPAPAASPLPHAQQAAGCQPTIPGHRPHAIPVQNARAAGTGRHAARWIPATSYYRTIEAGLSPPPAPTLLRLWRWPGKEKKERERRGKKRVPDRWPHRHMAS
nr:unnamed protein product [Digitaria exilis]